MVRSVEGLRSLTGRHTIPAWQNRHPRVQPRAISRVMRSWIVFISGTTGFAGSSHRSRSAMMRLRIFVPSRNTEGTKTPAIPESRSSTPSRLSPFCLACRSTSAISEITSSPSPMTMASKNGAMGSGLKTQGPPAITTGSPSRRSLARRATPPSSSMVRTFV